MRVLICCTTDSWGGLEQTAVRDAAALKKRSVDAEVLCLSRGAVLDKSKELGAVIHTVNSQAKYFNPELYFKLKKIADGFDVVHLHSFNTVFPLLFSLMGKKVKVFATRHIYVEHVKKDIFHRWYLSRIDKMLAVSDFSKKNILETYPISENKIQTLYLGIDLNRHVRSDEKAAKFRKDFNIPSGKKIVGVVGRIDPMKGQMEFVCAAPNVIQKYPDTHFVIVGRTTAEKENEYLAAVKNKVRELGIEKHVTFTGFCEDIPSALSAMDIFVMPSYFETFGLIAIEAMACGVPVIATDRGSINEIIPSDEYGIKIEPKNSGQISQAVIKILSSAEFSSKLKQKAMERTKNIFDQVKYFDKLIKIYSGSGSF
ncbi:MAG: glycosyltransferase family 4 protein [Pseudomonadota bacterium]